MNDGDYNAQAARESHMSDFDTDTTEAHERRITRCESRKLRVPRGSPIGDRIRAWCEVTANGSLAARPPRNTSERTRA